MDAPAWEAVVMIQQLGYAKAVAQAPSRTLVGAEDRARSAQSPRSNGAGAVTTRPEAPRSDAVVLGGFALDLAYSRQLSRVDGRTGQARVLAEQKTALTLEFDFASRALPRDASGEVDIEALANTEEKQSMLASLEALAETGLKDPGVLAGFVKSVDALFTEYEKDLSLSGGELDYARQQFVDEVKGFFAKVDGTDAPPDEAVTDAAGLETTGFDSLGDALEGLRVRVQARREDVMVAAGDLSKVLAERLDALRSKPAGEREAASLGSFLDNLKTATERRSTRDLRDGARERLLAADAEIPGRSNPAPPDAATVARGRAFMDALSRETLSRAA
jgi:hypothetical protein